MRPIKERREYYAAIEKKHFTPKEIVHLMPDDELEMNAKKGGMAAKAELKKREAIANLHPMPLENDLDLDIGV
jgi:hypothetical protein